MKNMRGLVLFFLFWSVSTFAASPDEIYQIISFEWDETEQKLVPYSIGSGTSVHDIGVVTNKHVVYNSEADEAVDFVLLCRGDIKRKQRSRCSIPAGLTAHHPEMDVALVQPVDGDSLIPASYPETLKQGIGDQVRVYGFPYSTSGNEFGDVNTLNKLKHWAEHGGELLGLGDKLTVTRGTIRTIYQDSFGNIAYYGTNAKGDFGSSGGGAFAYTGRYVGIPSYKDSEGNAILIAYSEIHDWLQEHKDLAAEVKSEALAYYKRNIAPPPNIFDQQRKNTRRNYLYGRNRSTSTVRRTYLGTGSALEQAKKRRRTSTAKPIYFSAPKLRYTGEP